MGLWGATDADEAKPKYLTDTEKRVVYATTKGWVQAAGGNDNASADAEVLVAIGDLSGATKLNIADISSVNWNITEFDKSAGGTLSVTANYNEQVAVTGTPTLTVTNDTNANHTLSYASGTGSNRLTFTLVIAAANAATDADDVLSVGANAIALNGGTIKDGVANATITHSALAASTNITVVA
jgi:hypothetical protein